MTTHSSILAWEIPWTEKPDGLQSMELQRFRHDLVVRYTYSHTQTHIHTHTHIIQCKMSVIKDTGYKRCENSVLCLHFSCESKIVLKNKVFGFFFKLEEEALHHIFHKSPSQIPSKLSQLPDL